MKHPVPNQKTVRSKSHKKTLIATTLSLAIAALAPQANALTATEKQLLEQVRILSAKIDALEKKSAQPSAAENRALDQKVRILERKIELADEDTAKKKLETPIVIASDKGFGFKSADPEKAFEVKLRGLIQTDARVFDEGIKGQSIDRKAPDNILARRVRPTIEGTLYSIYDFRITPDYGNGNSKLVDAYVDARFDPAYKVKVGKFTPPLGLERLQSSADTKFNELALTSNFIPQRDVGVQLHGDLFNGTTNYAVGVFNGALDGADTDNDTSNDKDIEGRLFFQPFTNNPGALQGLGFGIAASYVDMTGRTATPTDGTGSGSPELPTYKTIGQETFFSYRKDTDQTATTIADGRRLRVIPQANYYNGPLGLSTEWVNEDQGVERFNNGTNRTATLQNDGWEFTASWLLTGEDASYKGVTPKNNFALGQDGGWGAWELVFRLSELAIDDDAFTVDGQLSTSSNSFADPTKSAKEAHDWGVGVNWYLNKAIRVSLDYDNTNFDWGGGGTGDNPLDRPDEQVWIGRVQAAF